MDLLADYASSDEEGNEKQPPPPSHRVPPAIIESESAHQRDEGFLQESVPRRGGIFDSLPPPKASLFNSLPPPKSQSLANPKPQLGVEHRRGVNEEISENSNPKSSSSSLFSSLPRPKSSSQSSSGAKKVVQFKPPVITNSYSHSLDEDDDDDDEGEEERKRKRSREKISTSSPASFLSSIPAPRHSATLGVMPSGSGTGRRSMLETSVPASNLITGTTDANHNVGYSNNQANDANYAYSNWGSENATGIDGGMNTDSRNYEGYDHSTSLGGESYAYANVSTAGNEVGINSKAGSYEDVSYSYAQGQHVDYSNYGGGYGDYSNNVQYENNVGSSTALPEASGVVENVLSSVRGKRGRKDVPSEIVEVNQDELMKNRPREDQVKSTGIAFGPAYQPASTKGKPTKLHKRKHQIGSLYFDMRQKESELAERRSKGFLTKAQTQAKYGW